MSYGSKFRAYDSVMNTNVSIQTPLHDSLRIGRPDQNSITKFKQIYLQEYGVELSDAKAYELATNLVNLYRAVYLPIKTLKPQKAYEKTI
jgi:hypothetical protein